MTRKKPAIEDYYLAGGMYKLYKLFAHMCLLQIPRILNLHAKESDEFYKVAEKVERLEVRAKLEDHMINDYPGAFNFGVFYHELTDRPGTVAEEETKAAAITALEYLLFHIRHNINPYSADSFDGFCWSPEEEYWRILEILDDYWLSQPDEKHVEVHMYFEKNDGQKQHKTIIWDRREKGETV